MYPDVGPRPSLPCGPALSHFAQAVETHLHPKKSLCNQLGNFYLHKGQSGVGKGDWETVMPKQGKRWVLKYSDGRQRQEWGWPKNCQLRVFSPSRHPVKINPESKNGVRTTRSLSSPAPRVRRPVLNGMGEGQLALWEEKLPSSLGRDGSPILALLWLPLFQCSPFPDPSLIKLVFSTPGFPDKILRNLVSWGWGACPPRGDPGC